MSRLLLGLAVPFVLGAGGELPKDWKPYHSKEGRFQVVLPGVPLEYGVWIRRSSWLL